MELPPEIRNPLIALGVLLLIVSLAALAGYISMRYHAVRGRGAVRSAPHGQSQRADLGARSVRAQTQPLLSTPEQPIAPSTADSFAALPFGRVLALTPKERQAAIIA